MNPIDNLNTEFSYSHTVESGYTHAPYLYGYMVGITDTNDIYNYEQEYDLTQMTEETNTNTGGQCRMVARFVKGG